MFDSIAGLPLHPLVVHAAVVLLPLGALGVALTILVRSWRARFATPALVLLAAGAVSAFVAKESGEALAHRLRDEPHLHASYGDVLPVLGLGTLALAAGWWWLAVHKGRASTLVTALGLLTVLASVATVVLTVLTGHSGAAAVWLG